MGKVVLDTQQWGPNITDIRNFCKHNFIADCEDATKVVGYGSAPIKQKEAEERLARTIEAAPPGIIFSSNPHYGIYAKWDNLLIKAGFRMVSPKLCAINRVYRQRYDWKDKPSPYANQTRPPWESSDGFQHWIHAMYLVKEPVPALKFDFKKFDGANGDTDGHKMWAVGYGGRNKPPRASNGGYQFEDAYARLAHNCGCAMGYGVPKFGKYVDEEFFTIMVLPDSEKMPEGYTRFLKAGGMKFGHNLRKLEGDTAVECFHKFDVLT